LLLGFFRAVSGPAPRHGNRYVHTSEWPKAMIKINRSRCAGCFRCESSNWKPRLLKSEKVGSIALTGAVIQYRRSRGRAIRGNDPRLRMPFFMQETNVRHDFAGAKQVHVPPMTFSIIIGPMTGRGFILHAGIYPHIAFQAQTGVPSKSLESLKQFHRRV